MSRIERRYENCEIHDNSQDYLQSLRNLFKGLQGSPVRSYKNCENYEIYENCEINDTSQYQLQNQRNNYIQRVAGKAHRKLQKLRNLQKL